MNRHASFNRRSLNSAILAALVASGFAVPVQAVTRTWDGGGANDNWSFMQALTFNTNWVGALSLPVSGDTLVFDGVTRLTPNNDFVNLSVNGLVFNQGAGAFVLGGNAITSTGNIDNYSPHLQTINMKIKVGNDQTWDGGTAGMTVNGQLMLGSNALILQNLTSLNVGNTDLAIDNASLTLKSGSQLSNGITFIGNNGVGGISVSGAGSRWTGSGGLYIGNLSNGTGTMTIDDAGQVNNTIGYVGDLGSGQAKVTGANSRWNNSEDLYVGRSGDGTLTIDNGGQVSSDYGYLGYFGGSSGSATVTGANSTWANSSGLYIGYAGNATLAIENGGQISNTYGYLGDLIGSTGSATVTGANSKWTNSSNLYVGLLGNGSLIIEKGGQVSSVYGYLGYYGGSTGSATVTGTNSKWTNSGDLLLGLVGNGSLTIGNGGQVSNTHGVLGSMNGRTGSATVTGANSTWTNRGNFYIGDVGNGALTIENGGQVSNTNGVLGYWGAAVGSATVTGANSQWVNRNNLTVGVQGSGTLTIENGGTVNVGNALSIGNLGQLNLNDGTLRTGSLTRTGNGRFNWSGGTLNITGNGGASLGSGELNAVTQLSTGQTLDVTKTLNLNNGSFLLLSGGSLKAGTLALNGGSVIGGRLDMSGIGQMNGYGTVASAITGGTAANAIQASGGLSLGDINSASGFDFGGHLIVGSHRVVLLDQDQAHLGVSTTLTNGGQLEAGKGISLGNGETLKYTGDASILGNFTNNGAVSGSGGALTFLNDVNGAGSFAGDIVFHADYNPGNSPATVDFNGGNATYDATSVLTMEIMGSTPGTQYDQLLNIDHLSFNGILNLVFGPSFMPSARQSFDLFDFNSFSGSFAADRITVSGLDRSLLDLSHLTTTGHLQISAVPLPAGVWLFISGLAVLAAGSRRRE